MSAGDRPWLADYEMSRISTSYAMLKTIQPWYSLCVVVASAFHLREGVFTLWTFSCNLTAHLALTTVLMLTRGRLKEIEQRNMRSLGIGSQVFCAVAGFAWRAVVGPSSDGVIEQHRVYMYVALVLAFYAAGFGYVPGKYFHGCILPSFILSWNIFHFRVTSSASAQAGQAEVGDAAFGHLDAFFPSKERHGLVFDAGTPTLDVLRSSPIFAQAFGGGHCASLLDVVPEGAKGSFDDWVYDQVQHASVEQLRKSRSFLRDLTLTLPPGRGLTLEAKRAWLEFDDWGDTESCSIPVGLRLSGVSMKAGDAAWPYEDKHKPGQLSRIDSIPEVDDESLSDGDSTAAEDDGLDADVDASTEVSSMTAEDSASSASHGVDGVRLRTSRSRGAP